MDVLRGARWPSYIQDNIQVEHEIRFSTDFRQATMQIEPVMGFQFTSSG